MYDNLQLLRLLAKTYQRVSAGIGGEMFKNNVALTRSQGMLLHSVYQNNGIVQNQLAWITDRDKTSLARILQRMEKAGLVRRRSDAHDKRAKRVYITPKGGQLACEMEDIITNYCHRCFDHLSMQEKREAAEVLQNITKKVEENQV